MLRLWGRSNSINVQKAIWVLEEAGVAYERIDAGMAFGVVGTPEYAAKNPNNMIPTLEDGPLVVWESNAIVRYVAAKYAAATLWPADPGARALTDMWMDWQQTLLIPAIGPAFLGLIRTPPENRDQAVISASIARTAELMTRLDVHLRDRAHVGGEAFSMGDIPIGATVHRWYHLPLDRPDLPALKRYYDRIIARPAAPKALTLPVT